MELQEKIDLIKANKCIALLAPTFALDFEYPAIIGMLKYLGFDKVTELTYGARMVNWAYLNYIKENPNQKLFISSPCPNVVNFIKTQYPDFVKYLIPVVSPLVATTRIYKKHHPNHKIVFISPCWAKEVIEAAKYKEIDAVIALKDLKQIFDQEGIKAENFKEDYYFDCFVREYTKIYPISGGLASTSHIKKIFQENEILITDGIQNIKNVLEEIKSGAKPYRFLDLLNCDGGCIGGPAINNKDLSKEEKRKIILEYTQRSSKAKMGKEHEGLVDYAKGVDLSATF